MLRKLPIIVILGSTGTGKTKLSIELAQRFGGEVISADSMQVYCGLNVVTAKATTEEQKQVQHHMLDICEPGKEYNVVNFRDQALPKVNNLLEKSKIPIIVGGTNYYIESLLWQVLVSDLPATSQSNDNDNKVENHDLTSLDDKDINGCTVNKKQKLENINNENNSIENFDIDELHELDSLKLHEILTKVDPETAKRLHPNNRRKTIRALEVFKSGGTKLSEIIQEQRKSIGGSHLGGPLRYKHVILFWLRCDQDVLSERLDKRIADMVQQGLLNEIRTFYNEFRKNDVCDNFDKGILQTIGFKEFIPYLENFNELHDTNITNFMMKNSQTNIEESLKPDGMLELEKCLSELSLVTKRYSKKQLKWIANRFLTTSSREVPDIYGLDTSNVQNWHENVYDKAEQIVSSYINDEKCCLEPLKRKTSPREGLNEEITNFCDRCERRFVGEYQWQIHLKSNKHKKAYRKMGQIIKTPKTTTE